MSVVYDLQPPGLGGVHYGGSGLGVLGGTVPSTGQHGPAALYALLTPAETAKEVRFLVVGVPPTGTFAMDESSAFTWQVSGDGSFTFSGNWYIDGVQQTLATHDIVVGNTGLISATAALLQITGGQATVLNGAVAGVMSTIPAILEVAAAQAVIIGEEYVFRMPWTGADVVPKDKKSRRKFREKEIVERGIMELERQPNATPTRKPFTPASTSALLAQFKLIKELRNK